MRLGYLLLVSLTALLLSSCAVHKVTINKNLRILKRAVPQYKTSEAVSIKNFYKKQTVVEGPFGGLGNDVDLQEYSATVMKLISQGMEHQKIPVNSSSNKFIIVRLYDVKWGSEKGASIWALRGGGFELAVELSNGSVINLYQFKPSTSTKSDVYNSAILAATERLLKHPDFKKFINN